MLLKRLLEENNKADLQSFFLYWLPQREISSSREKLLSELLEGMTDQALVRQRFDALGRPHRAVLLALVSRDGYRGTMEQVLRSQPGRQIEEFEVEPTVKTLLDDGLIFLQPGSGSNGQAVYVLADEVGDALRRTITLDGREASDILARSRRQVRLPIDEVGGGRGLRDRLAAIDDSLLAELVERAMDEHRGILGYSEAQSVTDLNGSLGRPEWRDRLEESGIGTIGILSLKDYGIDIEEEALVIDQDLLYMETVERASRCHSGRLSEPGTTIENDIEIYVGTDFIIDVDRFLELIRTEEIDVTRQRRLYRKTEDRISSVFITSKHDETFEGSAASCIFDICRKLRFISFEGQKIVGDPLRRLAWQKKSIDAKLKTLWDLFLNEQQDQRWSFHQKRLRGLFIDLLKCIRPGSWIAAQPLFTAVVARYLLLLEELGVRDEFQERCDGDLRGEEIMVPFARLHHGLSHWVVHRMALLGLVDTGYQDGAFRSLRLSHLGLRFFDLIEEEGEAGERTLLVNPDFEVMAFPGNSRQEEINLLLSKFADRQESDRVKRYRLTRESLERGIVAGLDGQAIRSFLEENIRAPLPSNVEFSLREWTEGVELVRKQRILLLRATSREGADRMQALLEERDIHHERLNERCVAIRGSKNERAVDELRDVCRKLGLLVE